MGIAQIFQQALGEKKGNAGGKTWNQLRSSWALKITKFQHKIDKRTKNLHPPYQGGNNYDSNCNWNQPSLKDHIFGKQKSMNL